MACCIWLGMVLYLVFEVMIYNKAFWSVGVGYNGVNKTFRF